MKKGFQLYFLPALVAGLGVASTACNSSEGWESEPQNLAGTEVSAFSLKANSNVLNNLDSVFFSIDLIGGRIFNASPLPYGTETDSLAVAISADACSVAEIYVTRTGEKQDTVINYLTSPDEFVDFSYGPVRLHLVSADGSSERDYQITVNVAPEVSDSLYWDKLQKGQIYGVDNMLLAKTVKLQDRAVTLSTDHRREIGISVFVPAAATGGGTWDTELILPLFTKGTPDVNTPVRVSARDIDVESFTATDEGFLYIRDNNGNLYMSTDRGATFVLVDTGWLTITAPYRDSVLGVKDLGGNLKFTGYSPHSGGWEISDYNYTFPMRGTSAAAAFSTKWTDRPQIVILGGNTSTNNPTGAAWAFDGTKWAMISDQLPAGGGYAMSKYVIAETDTMTWTVKSREVLIAFGGIRNSVPSKEVWISRDMGVNWQKGSSLLQLPDYIPAVSGASLLVFDKTLEVGRVAPRAVKPITQWDCPYLYLFGGYDVNESYSAEYWSGVVNHWTVKPVQ